MKTITDLFELVAKETEMSQTKMVKYFFDIDTRYKWVSMYVDYNCGDDNDIEELISKIMIRTPEEIQLAYWSIYNKGRSSNS